MKVVVLAGGRGRRLGALTEKRQKATLNFDHCPLIIRILTNLLGSKRVEQVIVLTGYRGEDVHQVLLQRYPHHLKTERLQILDFPFVKGTLSRLVTAIPFLGDNIGCYVCGIDSIVPKVVVNRFLVSIDQNQNQPILLLSPNLKIAPTHKRVQLVGEVITEYVAPHECRNYRYYCDVGVRYFPADTLLAMQREIDDSQELYIPTFIRTMLNREQKIIGLPFLQDWCHFASARDFAKPLHC